MMSPLRAAIWCAVSTHAQHEPEKVSLPEQEEQSRLHAQKRVAGCGLDESARSQPTLHRFSRIGG